MLPWNRINDFVLKCGDKKSPHEFGISVLNHIAALVPFDQGRLYFLDESGDVEDVYLIGIGKRDVEDYFKYYSKMNDGAFSVKHFVFQYSNRYPKTEECIRDMNSYSGKQISEYITSLGIKYSFGLGLWDQQGMLRCLFSLDRICNVPFSSVEIQTIEIVFHHLNNLYQNFYILPFANETFHKGLTQDQSLTKRETEIAQLMKKGITPANISKKLCISFTTVNKHISNMHKKLNVSTRQELIVKLHEIL